MAMKLVKKTPDYKIFMRGDDRYAVQDASGKPLNGEEKVSILVSEDLIKMLVPGPTDVADDEGLASAGEAEESEAPAAVAVAENDAVEPEPEPEPEAEDAPADDAEDKEQ